MNINKIINIGVEDNMSPQDKILHKLFNQINLILIVVYSILAIGDIVEINVKGWEFTPDLYMNYITVILCIVHIYLHKIAYFNLAIFLLLVDILVITLFFGPIAGRIFTGIYFWGPYAPTFALVLPYLFLAKKSDAKLRHLCIFIYFLITISYDFLIVSLPFSNRQINEIINQDIIFYKLAPVASFIFLNFSLHYFFKLNTILQKQLINSYKLAENSNVALKKLNEERNRIFKIMGHDLKSPMASAVQVCSLLKSKIKTMTTDETLKIISLLETSARKGLNLLTDLVEWSKLQPVDISVSSETFNVHKLINKIIDLLLVSMETKNISCKNEVPEELKVFANIRMIEAVIRNLISNAIKFSLQNGEIIITGKYDNNFAQICIADTGVGMKSEDLKKIFNDNKTNVKKGTNNEKGTGLGLIFCRDFIHNHNGKIWVKSTPNKGTTFCFTLPK